jgi:hypothetical protein
MDWWFRLHMDLPPRVEDLEELRRIAPELFIKNPRIGRRPEHGPYRWQYQEWIRRWIGSGERRDYPPSKIIDATNCPRLNCPFKDQAVSGVDERRTEREGSDEIRIDFMALGGGKKPPLRMFLDAARRINAGKGATSELFITDGYIFSSQGWRGTPGGINNSCNTLTFLSCIRERPSGRTFMIAFISPSTLSAEVS